MNSAAGERREIEYAVHGGVSLKGHLYAPKGSGKFPLVIAIHGGGWRLANLDNYRLLGPWLAERGYATLAVTHRLSKPAEKVYPEAVQDRSEEHTSELQSQSNLVCRLLLEKKK